MSTQDSSEIAPSCPHRSGVHPVHCAECWDEAAAEFGDAVDVHTFFGLSYASYLVVNRSLLQSMPLAWQFRFTTLMGEMWGHFDDEYADVGYEVRVRDRDTGRYRRDPIPNYQRGRTFIPGRGAS
jgi:hypothetical protein